MIQRRRLPDDLTAPDTPVVGAPPGQNPVMSSIQDILQFLMRKKLGTPSAPGPVQGPPAPDGSV